MTTIAASALWEHDARLLARAPGCWVIGVDEVGRGALAGPVVAGAVALGPSFFTVCKAADWAGVRDSKQLPVEVRQRQAGQIVRLAEQAEGHCAVGTGWASVEEIERHNILGATTIAMIRAIEAVRARLPLALEPKEPLLLGEAREGAAESARLWVDGLPVRGLPWVHEALKGGDGRSLSIALAANVAKVARDAALVRLDADYPGYGFGAHKGYGTERHRQALRTLGPCRHHRRLFLRKVLA